MWVAAAGGGSGVSGDSWQRRRLSQLREGQSAPRCRPTSSPAGRPQQPKPNRTNHRSPPQPGGPSQTLDEEAWQEELKKRSQAQHGAASTSLPRKAVPNAAGQAAGSRSPVASSTGQTEGKEEGEEKEKVPARLRRSAVPKPYRLPVLQPISGVGRSSINAPGGVRVLRSTKKRRQGPSAVADVFEEARTQHLRRQDAEGETLCRNAAGPSPRSNPLVRLTCGPRLPPPSPRCVSNRSRNGIGRSSGDPQGCKCREAP